MKQNKQTIKLNESKLKQVIKESIKEALNYRDIDDDNYFGGGLPEPETKANRYSAEKDVIKICNEMKPFIEQLTDVFNNYDMDSREPYDEAMNILDGFDKLPELAKHFYNIEIP